MISVALPAKTWGQRLYFLLLGVTVLGLVVSLGGEVAYVADLLPAIPMVLLPAYGVTLVAYWIRQPHLAWSKWLSICLLPLLLVLFCYVALASMVSLPTTQFWLVLPIGMGITYFNLGATIFAGRRALDRGRCAWDGQRILGNGKTVEGTLGGLLVASAIYGVVARGVNAGMVVIPLAMVGDMLASFGKRRAGWGQGQQVFLLDQLDGVVLFVWLEWQWQGVGLTASSLLVLVLGTFFVQVYGNVILYLLGKKAVPW